MSHSKERKEKVCLNCSAELHGRFCHSCGQENIEPKESFWSLVTHFAYDITHFDGKFFSTVGTLIRRPGVLSKDYIEGRRARYLHPIRMYVFTSAFFFIIFYSFVNVNVFDDDEDDDRPGKYELTAKQKLDSARIVALRNANTREDSISITNAFKIVENSKIAPLENDSTSGTVNFGFSSRRYRTRVEYDSVQKSLPASEKDGWFRRMIIHRSLEIKKKYTGEGDELLRNLTDKFVHTFPYLLFLSLPLFALYLKLLYIRRKQFFYADHAVFLIHLYIFTFIILLIFFALDKLSDYTGWGILGFLEAVVLIYGVVYAVRGMKKFYLQRWGKTLLKFVLLNVVCLVSLVFLFSLFMIITLFRV